MIKSDEERGTATPRGFELGLPLRISEVLDVGCWMMDG